MAQYKDIDEILKNLPDDLPYKSSVKRVLIQAPTADVVPKSEYEALSNELERTRSMVDNLRDDIRELKQAKVEVAKEIFAEIEKIRIMENCCQRVNVCYDTTSEYEELKKKYTIGE